MSLSKRKRIMFIYRFLVRMGELENASQVLIFLRTGCIEWKVGSALSQVMKAGAR
ncbi:hypothetical protein [Anaerospora hongkongensis]|uniref:hypothetical protein n=1 Tax=Anaerospora hongkongensis TaxID=244830 RepID=UPI002FD920E2